MFSSYTIMKLQKPHNRKRRVGMEVATLEWEVDLWSFSIDRRPTIKYRPLSSDDWDIPGEGKRGQDIIIFIIIFLINKFPTIIRPKDFNRGLKLSLNHSKKESKFFENLRFISQKYTHVNLVQSSTKIKKYFKPWSPVMGAGPHTSACTKEKMSLTRVSLDLKDCLWLLA